MGFPEDIVRDAMAFVSGAERRAETTAAPRVIGRRSAPSTV